MTKFGDESFSSFDVGVFQGNFAPPTFNGNATCTAAAGVAPAPARKLMRGRHSVLMSARHATISSLASRVARFQPGTALHATVAAQLAVESRQAAVHTAAFTGVAQMLGYPTLEEAMAAPVHVTQWNCYREAHAALAASACGKHTDYTLRYSRLVAGLCEGASGATHIAAHALSSSCTAAAQEVDAEMQ